jgi:hypothetical protein
MVKAGGRLTSRTAVKKSGSSGDQAGVANEIPARRCGHAGKNIPTLIIRETDDLARP